MGPIEPCYLGQNSNCFFYDAEYQIFRLKTIAQLPCEIPNLKQWIYCDSDENNTHFTSIFNGDGKNLPFPWIGWWCYPVGTVVTWILPTPTLHLKSEIWNLKITFTMKIYFNFQSYRNFTQSPDQCKTFKTIGKLRNELWAKGILRILNLTWHPVRYPVLKQPPGKSVTKLFMWPYYRNGARSV